MKREKKKLLFVTYDMTYSGSPRALMNLVSIVLSDYDIDVWTYNSGLFENEFLKIGVEVQEISETYLYTTDFRKRIKQYDIAVVYTLFCLDFARVAQDYIKTYLYLMEGQNIPQLCRDCNIEEEKLKSIKNIICVSEYAKDFLANRYGLNEVDIIHNYVNPIKRKKSKNKETTRDKIPTCITVDIFGTLLWFDYPQQDCTYTSLKLLADCKAILQPSSTMIAQLNKQLDEAYKRRDITEDTFLFMRSHPIVRNKLLDVTSGDYSSFTDHTWRDVYSLIQSHAQYEGDKKYEEEKSNHDITKKQLELAKMSITEASDREQQLNEKIAAQNDKYSSILAKIVAIMIYAVPYIAISLVVLFVQNTYVNWSIRGILLGAVTIVTLLLLSTLFKKLESSLKKIFLK